MSALLEVQGLTKTYAGGGLPWRRRKVHALDGVERRR